MRTDHKVILGLRWGEISGVDVFSAHLGNALLQQGIPAQILLTHSTSLLRLPLAKDIPVHRLNFMDSDSWGTRWRRMRHYLESQAPCIYIPNYDYNYSCVSPKLSNRVIILGIVHSDDPLHYEHVKRLGRYWNGIVAVSRAIADKVIAADGDLARRLTVLPYGVEVPPQIRKTSTSSMDGPIKIIYVGRLIDYQKRVLELPKIFSRLHEEKIPFKATVVGDGPDRDTFLKMCDPLIAKGLVQFTGVRTNRDVHTLLEEHDVIVLVSDFEGLPLCLLEGMARGCIPVVTQIRSGIPELIEDGNNGFIIAAGDIASFVNRLGELQKTADLRRKMSDNAIRTITTNFDQKVMLNSYIAFMTRLIHESETRTYRRPAGKILAPPSLKITWKDHLPSRLRLVGRKGKRLFRRSKNRVSKNGQTNPV